TNVRVRPVIRTPLASGFISRAGTASLAGVSSVANFGLLREVSGLASRLAIQTQPSASAVAGTAFAQQPAIRIEDSSGNLITSDSSTVVSAAIASGTDALQGTTTATAVNGLATFANLA